MPTDKNQIDTTIQIVTPENIAFKYRVAGPFHRLLAYSVDLMIRIGVFFAGWIALLLVSSSVGLPSLGIAGGLILWFLLAWFYGGAFEALWNGQTPGKRFCQLRVLTVDGCPINGVQAVLRNVLREVDMLPLPFVDTMHMEFILLRWMGVYLVGLVTVMLNDRFQRLGDLACGTIVVVEERSWYAGVIRVTEPEAIRLAGLIPPSFQASRSLARTLAVYVERRGHFPFLRRMEIARHLGEPLRERFGLPLGTDLDQLLCGVYHRTFITDRNGADAAPVNVGSPFAGPPAAIPAPAATPAPPEHALAGEEVQR